ncbi:MAG: hypothetical protein ABL959_13740 [Pyrinomonadaceae bacterium]
MLREEKRLRDFADAGEEKVAAMLGSLKRVDAPADFDFRVRARIAQGRPAGARTSWFPTFARVAAPAVMLAAVGGYFGYSALYQSDEVYVAEVVESGSTINSRPASSSENVQPSEPVAKNTPDGILSEPAENVIEDRMTFGKDANVTREVKAIPANRRPSTDLNQGGSREDAQGITNTISISPVANTGDSRPTNARVSLSVLEVFGAMGIRASFSGTGWRVSSASGRAAAAGLKTGDIIETVNGKSVGANTVFDEKFVGSAVRVKRDGITINISF